MTHNTQGNDPGAVGAVVLLSGGLDSATVLAMARAEGRRCVCLSFDYGQRHRFELTAASELARLLGASRHVTVPIGLDRIGGSALTDDIEVPKDREDNELTGGIPVTYVPARNLVFLSIASGLAEVNGCSEVWLGVNAIDYSGYPDCRPEFIESFAQTASLATKAGVEHEGAGAALRVRTPLISMTKADIIKAGTELGVPYERTQTCYDPDPHGCACGRCDACVLRRRGFEQAGVPDPTRYTR
ncbi:MAG: 7-cyano-7-deazaguanine synthase QueC [Planctomycetota bacterium]